MKVALITGGTSGFGEAAAAEMGRRGWHVAVMARSRPHRDFFTVPGDVGEDADCRRVARTVLDALGPEIRVNNVNPGFARTPWQVAAHGEEGAARLEEKYAALAPLKAAPAARDVADAVAWLIEGARATTGEVLFVDGGMHVASPR